MRRLITLCAAAIVSGCVTQNMNAGLNSLLGQDIHVAVSKLGYPTTKRQMLGDTIYVWAVQETATGVMPVTSTTTGMVGGNLVTLNNTDYVPTVENYQCTIELAVDSHDIVKHYEWRGNMGGCGAWARQLKPAT